MAFPGLKYASSGLLAALKASSRLTRRTPKPDSPVPVSGSATPVDTKIEPAVASMAHLQRILETYLKPADVAQVRNAYRFADQAHLGQFRSSGSPYITHPIAVAEICAGWKLDLESLCAALLHDVMEDQGIAKHEIQEKFGDACVC